MARLSHSKIDTYVKCPKRYDYEHRQGLQTLEESPILVVGKLFHAVLEAENNFEDTKEFYDEFDLLVRSGALKTCKEGTLKNVVKNYTQFYFPTDSKAKNIFIEKKYEHLTKDADVISGVIDRLYELDSYVYLQDTKTTLNKLKYDIAKVTLHKQLNKYGYVCTNDFGIKPDFIVIDEVVIHDLEKVPLLNSGKPTRDIKQLTWVLYEDYLDILEDQGLESNPDYQTALTYLKDRGHPLFQRVIIPFVYTIAENIYEQEYIETIKSIEFGTKHRNEGPLCNYCPYQELCKLELIGEEEDLIKTIREEQFILSDDVDK